MPTSKTTPEGRRSFLKQGAFGAVGALTLPFAATHARPTFLPASLNLVFQGDSITDAGRNRAQYYANQAGGMGHGYVHYVVTHLMGRYPETRWRCYNRGVSGDKVHQLAARWEEDCIQLQPDVLSILVGVNDFWHTLTHGYQGDVNRYENDYRTLLTQTRARFPEVKLLIGEPFAVPGGTAIDERWYPEFNAYRFAAKKLAEEFDAVFIPYQSLFDGALRQAPASYWCPDGVHPSLAGCYLMAEAWLKGFFSIME